MYMGRNSILSRLFEEMYFFKKKRSKTQILGVQILTKIEFLNCDFSELIIVD